MTVLSLLLAISSLPAASEKITATETPTLSSPAEIESMVEDCINTTINGQFSIEKVAEVIDSFEKENHSENADWSVEVIDLATGRSAGYDEEEMQTAASSVKLFIAGAIMEEFGSDPLLEEGEEQEKTETAMDPDILYMLRSMLIISDNDAATSLIYVLGNGSSTRGKEAVNEYCRRYGFDSTYLGILFTGIDPDGTYNATSAHDTARFMEMIYNDELPGSTLLLDLLSQSERLEKIPAALPAGIRSANKTGELDMTQNDTAIIYAKRPFVLSILIDDEDFFQGGRLIRDLTQEIFPIFNESGKER